MRLVGMVSMVKGEGNARALDLHAKGSKESSKETEDHKPSVVLDVILWHVGDVAWEPLLGSFRLGPVAWGLSFEN